MPRFRDWTAAPAVAAVWPDPAAVRDGITDAFRPDHFFVGGGLRVDWAVGEEEPFWELFQGRAMDRTQTREKRRFLAWSAWEDGDETPADEPLLAVRWDREAGQVHVTRSILTRAWEGYADEAGAIQSRQTVRRARELVATIDLSRMPTATDFRDELVAALFHAVVGTSRLPLTSVESPLPAFTLGQMAYCYRPDADGVAPSVEAFIDRALQPGLAKIETVKLFELAVRQPDDQTERCTDAFDRARPRLGERRPVPLPDLFNEISLSPYLGVVGAVLRYVRRRVEPEAEVDLLAHLLRQSARHLTAFDLVKFHHRGANYPDALLVEEVFAAVLDRATETPELFLPADGDRSDTERTKRLRRRGLRQGWLIRETYRGHRVPDAPTSPGENARVWPSPVPHVPEEQILQLGERRQELFTAAGHDLTAEPLRRVFRACVEDLNRSSELRELGVALFLDRPFGVGKRPTEPDRTPLLSYVAFSRNVAGRRLQFFRNGGWMDSEQANSLGERLRSAEFDGGIRFAPARPAQRPGTASLEDALLAADDFVFLRSTRRSVEGLVTWFDVSPLERLGLRDLLTRGECLVLRSDERPDEIVVYDAGWRRRLVLRADLSEGYVARIGVELPAAGLRVLDGSEDLKLLPRP